MLWRFTFCQVKISSELPAPPCVLKVAEISLIMPVMIEIHSNVSAGRQNSQSLLCVRKKSFFEANVRLQLKKCMRFVRILLPFLMFLYDLDSVLLEETTV